MHPVEARPRQSVVKLNGDSLWQGSAGEQADKARRRRYFEQWPAATEPIGSIQPPAKIRAVQATHVDPGQHAHVDLIIQGLQYLGDFLADAVAAGAIGNRAGSEIRGDGLGQPRELFLLQPGGKVLAE